ncbi:MAG: hypothetical protein N2C14_23420 [Planctomycetales bacterium]
MTLATGRTKLNYALKTLRIRWEDVQDHWDDAASRRFQEQHLEPMEPPVQDALRGIDMLAEVLQRAKKACS